MHVLLVEPDIISAKAYKAQIESAGHSVDHAKSAQSAIRSADKKRPDVVVLEVNIARHNGIEFLYEFCSYTEWQSIPVVVLTARASRFDKYQVLKDHLSVAELCDKAQADSRRLVEVISSYAEKPSE